MSELLAVLADLEPIDPDGADAPPRLPALERLLSRAEAVAAPADWRRFVAERLGADLPSGELPVGATVAAAAGLATDGGTWLLATPVHLLATLSDVRMHPAGPLPLDGAAAAMLASRVTTAFAGEGFELRAVGAHLLARFHDALDVRTTDPAPHAGRRIDVQLPGGPDGGRLRRRMTELQMMLHDAPLAAREGAVPANALWLWGGGRSLPRGRIAWPTVDSDDPFVVALHRLDGERVDRAGARLVTWRLASLANETPDEAARSAEAAGEGGTDAFAAADRRWFAALEHALASGRLRRAVVHFAGRAYVLRPSQRWRFWTRPRPWWELAA
jgi:hypothetical protein